MKKKQFLLLMPFLLLGQLCFISCKKDPPVDPNNGQPNEVAIGTLDLGTNVTADFQGRVVDEMNNPIANVTITAGNKTAQTDANGMFVIIDATVKEKLAYVEAEKPGYFSGSRSVIPTQDASNFIRIQLLTLTIAETISSETVATVTLNGGASIDFYGAYVDGNGNAYHGEVAVAATYLSPSSAETWDQMPGMLYAQNDAGQAGSLVTYGMIVVELFGEAGQSLNLAQGTTAKLHLPVDPDQAGTAPPTIPLWFFDEVAGYWIEEGSATLTDGEYVGEVAHFTFWNCDVFYESCMLNGSVTDNAGNPLGNATIEINSGGMNSIGFTNSDGSFYTYLAANQTSTFDVSYGCGATPVSYTVGPYATGSVNSQTFVAGMGSSYANITGTLVNCDNLPVTNGDIYLSDGVNYVYEQITDGTIDLIVPYCGGTTTDIYYSIVDYDQPYSYVSSGTVAFSYPTVDLGTMMICDSISTPGTDSLYNCDPLEYLQIIVDGVMVQSDSCVYFSYADGAVPEGFLIWGTSDNSRGLYSQNVTSTGTFVGTTMVPTPGEVIFYTNYDMDTSCPLNFTTTISSFGGIGGYVTMELNGTYTDVFGTSHTVSVQVSAYNP
ncbi:MAG: carboxypeptidase regulatory-like domain-containing protein [Bacteroidetes bacterium]|nr:carboxypeptidase regulatory-like domain-containing protein [Bacteroidota bacterium]